MACTNYKHPGCIYGFRLDILFRCRLDLEMKRNSHSRPWFKLKNIEYGNGGLQSSLQQGLAAASQPQNDSLRRACPYSATNFPNGAGGL